jgi:DNA-binding NtrC family response regulator
MFLQLGDILEINMAQILIVGKDWTSRALLRAQLIEEGFDVEAYEDVRAAVDRLWGSAEMPSILVVDLFEGIDQVEDVATLSHWAKLLPIWILAGHTAPEAVELEGQGFEKIMFRPVDVGKLVLEIKQRLAE